jgi:hypothetical protein
MKHKSSTELQTRAWRARLEARLGDLFELKAQARSSAMRASELHFGRKFLEF